MKLYRNNSAVSQIIGYSLSLSLMALVVTFSVLMVNTIVDEKINDAAETQAEDIANYVTNSLINVVSIKEKYPDTNYTTSIDVPYQLVGKYNYYIESNNKYVFVNSTNGAVSVKKSVYNITNRMLMDIEGIAYGVESGNKLLISCNRSDYVYKFDFGTNSSVVSDGYMKITDKQTSLPWALIDWDYRTPIYINNPLSYDLENYQVLIQLNDDNFDHSLVNENLSDLRFLNRSGGEQSFWVEKWYSNSTHTSRIWVNVTEIPAGGCHIYMYYGNPSASLSSKYGGDKTFLFFDDFTGGITTNWGTYYHNENSEIEIKDGKLKLTDGAAIISKEYINARGCPYVIETKARSKDNSGDHILEASMFVRSTNGTKPPFKNGFVFSSGSFPHGSNLTISYFDNVYSEWISLTDPHKDAINQDWYRLKCILNDSAVVIVRYYYDNFVLDDPAAGIKYSLPDQDGNFGLCIANNTYIDSGKQVDAYYDWVIVRKFVTKPGLTGGGREDAEPVAYVNGTESRNFYWEDNVASKAYSGSERGKDMVYNKYQTPGTGSFSIEELKDKPHSLVFTYGDSEGTPLVNNMKITIKGDSTIIRNLKDCSQFRPNKKFWISNIIPDDSGTIKITFDDEDPGNRYWAINELTVEKGERIIKIKKGDLT